MCGKLLKLRVEWVNEEGMSITLVYVWCYVHRVCDMCVHVSSDTIKLYSDVVLIWCPFQALYRAAEPAAYGIRHGQA